MSDSTATNDPPNVHNIQQSGKFGVNIDRGEGVHIGDVIYKSEVDAEEIKQIVREELRLPVREYGETVSIGLQALAELMQDLQVRSAVINFQGDFEAACQQIETIANYKELHDLLHALEFQCYSGIVQEIKRLPDDETALDILADRDLTLQSIIAGVRDVAQRQTVSANEVVWLKDLESASVEFQGGLESIDMKKLQRTIWLLNRIISIQPSRINTNLNAAARMLRLPELLEALQCICRELNTSPVNEQKFEDFKNGVILLEELNCRLNNLVDGHDYWQGIDLELRRIEANLELNIEELIMSWPDLELRTIILFEEAQDEWTKAFAKESNNLSVAVSERNPVKMKRYFRMYRRRANERFYQVDITLRRLCEELRKVGEPLAVILRMVI
jgi:hypothetical protein